MKNIAFIGATGLLGAPVARALATAGFDVTALVRDPTVAQSKQLANVRLLPGNMKSPVDLKKLLTGQDAVYMNLSIKQTEKENDWHTEDEGLNSLLAVEAFVFRMPVVFFLSLFYRKIHVYGILAYGRRRPQQPAGRGTRGWHQ